MMGSQGGYIITDGLCDAEYTGTHLCTLEELVYTKNNFNLSEYLGGQVMLGI